MSKKSGWNPNSSRSVRSTLFSSTSSSRSNHFFNMLLYMCAIALSSLCSVVASFHMLALCFRLAISSMSTAIHTMVLDEKSISERRFDCSVLSNTLLLFRFSLRNVNSASNNTSFDFFSTYSVSKLRNIVFASC